MSEVRGLLPRIDTESREHGEKGYWRAVGFLADRSKQELSKSFRRVAVTDP
jgi:hypothetical protein